MSTAKQALTDLQKKKFWPVYFLYGEEPFKIQEFITKVKEQLFTDKTQADFCVDKLDGSQSKGADVLGAVQSLGLFGGGGTSGRLVIVKQAHLLKETEDFFEALQEAKDASPWDDSVLILIAESLDGRKKLHQWLKKKGFALEFKKATDAELQQWIQYMAKKQGATIEPQAAQWLAVISEGSLERLQGDIEKAWLYAGASDGVVLTEEHVRAVTGSQVSHEMAELVQAVLAAKRTRAMVLVEKLIQGSEDALGFVGFMTWALKNPGRGFQFQTSRAREILLGLVELDQRLKSSGLEPQALVEEFVLSGSSSRSL